MGPFDLRGRHGHAVALLQGAVAGHGLTIDADQVVFAPAAGQVFRKELIYGDAAGHLDVIGIAAAVVVNEFLLLKVGFV